MEITPPVNYNINKVSFQTRLFLGVLLVIVGVSSAILYINRKASIYDQTASSYKPGVFTEIDKAISQAQTLYAQKKAAGVDFSDGPCLTNDLMKGWVADLVHNPRIMMDDLAQNQCQAYLEGRASHFVELDLAGNLVRVH